jgi:hypothetical protein
MRQDMSKQITECYRYKHGSYKAKAERRRINQELKSVTKVHADDELIQEIGDTFDDRISIRGKKIIGRNFDFGENLNPLFQYIKKQIGRNVDEVYSEVKAAIPDGTLGDHVMLHYHYYLIKVRKVNGVYYNHDKGTVFRGSEKDLFYEETENIIRSLSPEEKKIQNEAYDNHWKHKRKYHSFYKDRKPELPKGIAEARQNDHIYFVNRNFFGEVMDHIGKYSQYDSLGTHLGVKAKDCEAYFWKSENTKLPDSFLILKKAEDGIISEISLKDMLEAISMNCEIMMIVPVYNERQGVVVFRKFFISNDDFNSNPKKYTSYAIELTNLRFYTESDKVEEFHVNEMHKMLVKYPFITSKYIKYKEHVQNKRYYRYGILLSLADDDKSFKCDILENHKRKMINKMKDIQKEKERKKKESDIEVQKIKENGYRYSLSIRKSKDRADKAAKKRAAKKNIENSTTPPEPGKES